MNSKIKDFLTFRLMVTPLIIQVLFWIGVFFSVIWGLTIIGGGFFGLIAGDSFLALVGGLCLGPMIIVFGIIAARLYTELLILFFKMHESLEDIKKALEK